MNFIELKLKGVFLLEAEVFEDKRGKFWRSFCQKEFEKVGLNPNVSQGNISINPILGTLRGFHYQSEPCKEAKTISCLNGEIYDVIIDLRKSSPTYLDHCSVKISSNNKKSIHIPYGCANAWITTMSNTIIHYYMSDPYSPNYGQGIRYNDPFFKISWPMEPNLISEKDLNYTDFDKNKHIN
tara:strand:- start:32 stop:577 length:546 start_codon:yes stop_codon:yes gene_type:complete